MELEKAKQSALNDLDYYIHEAEENGISKETVDKLKKGQYFINKAQSVATVKDHSAILQNIFDKAFK